MQHIRSAFSAVASSYQLLQRTSLHAVGCFKLLSGCALTLAANTPGELRMAHGLVWLTFNNAAQDASVRAGDHFLEPGAILRLSCGQTVVMEALDTQPDAAAYISWMPDTALIASLSVSAQRLEYAQVRQPLRDLGAALYQAGRALGRLVQGLAGSLACTLMLRGNIL